MSSKHDDDKDDKYGRKSSGSSYASSHSSGYNGNAGSGSTHSNKSHGKASEFDTSKLVGDDGNFFGMHVSSDTARQLNLFGQTMLAPIRRLAEEHGGEMAANFAKTHLGHNPTQALHFGNSAANAIGWGLIFGKQIFEVGDNVYDTMKQLNALNAAAKPIQKAGGEGAGMFGGDDEGLANARAKINAIFWQRLVNTAAGALGTLPQIYLKSTEMNAKLAEKEKILEYKALEGKTPKEKAQWIRDQRNKQISGGVLMDGKTKMELENLEREDYLKNFEKFKLDNRNKIETELKKELLEFDKTVNGSTKHHELHNWERFEEKNINYDVYNKDEYLNKKYQTWQREVGSNPERERTITVAGKKYTGTWDKIGETVSEAQRQEEIKMLKKRLEARFKVVLEEEIKARYVKEFGAYDNNWTKYLHYGENYKKYGNNGVPKAKTIKEQNEELLAKVNEKDNPNSADAKKKSKEEEKEINHVRDFGLGLVGAFLGDMAQNMFGTNLDQFKKPQAFDRVLHLQRSLEKSGDGNTPERIPGIKSGKEGEPDCSYALYVHKTFQQHQIDSLKHGKKGYAEIGERFTEKLERVKWDDKAIQALSDDELNPYEYAVKHISKRLKDGRLNGNSLGYLVFNKKDKIVKDSGKDFGPIAGGSEQESRDAIHALLDRVSQSAVSAVVMDEKAVGEALGRFSFTTEELKQAFGPNGLQGDERTFFFALVNAHMPDHKVLCRVTGLSEGECERLRTECQAKFERSLDAAVAEISEMLKNNPEALDKLSLTEAEKKLITTTESRATKEGKVVTDIVTNKKDLQSLETVVANATMEMDGGGKGDGFWQKVVSRSATPKVPVAVPEKAENTPKGYGDSALKTGIAAHEGSSQKPSFASRETKKTSYAKDSFDDFDSGRPGTDSGYGRDSFGEHKSMRHDGFDRKGHDRGHHDDFHDDRKERDHDRWKPDLSGHSHDHKHDSHRSMRGMVGAGRSGGHEHHAF